jgi:TonB-linked SusC/RagA family outer membrane protein
MKKILLSCSIGDGLPRLLLYSKLIFFIVVFLGCLRISAYANGAEIGSLDPGHIPDRCDKPQKEIIPNKGYLKRTTPARVMAKETSFSYFIDQTEAESLGRHNMTAGLLPMTSSPEHLYVQQKITGTVVDEKGTPLVGVTVKVKGSGQGTVTDSKGAFALTVPDNATLEVSYIGYQTQDVMVDGKANLAITMKISASGLNEVVVVGYGTKSKATMTGAVSTVSVASLKQAPVTNFSNTLAGKLPGVVTINNSGEPGEDNSTILIRGNHSLNNNAPLIVIDGVPNRGGGLSRLNPNDIESISVLKDATASIYGSESANGVILITTKRGRKNQPAQFTLNFNRGFNQPTRVPKMADAPTYMAMLNEAALYHGLPIPYSSKDIQAYNDPNRDPWLYPSTNWFKAALKPRSPQMNGDMSVQGGTSNLTYFLSLGAQTEDGYYRRSATRYNQFNFRSNISDQITKNIKLSFDLSGRKEDRNFPTVSAGQTFRMLIRGRPVDPAYFPNGFPGPDQENGVQPVVTGTTQTGTDRNQRYYMTGDVSLDVTIPGFTGFDLQGHLSYNKEFEQIKDWQKPWTLYSFDKQAYINNGKKDATQFLTPARRGPTDPQLTQTSYQQENILENLVANYKHSFGDHNIALMVGTEQQRFQDANFKAFRRHFISTSIPELFAGGQEDWSNDGSAAHGTRMSYFSRADYNYKGKYLFEFVGRYDGSYLFPPNTRFGFFPAFSAGWRLTEEPFFKDNVSLFNELKLRASWGRTGNDITDPNSLVEAQQYLGGYQFGGGYVFGIDQVVPSIYQSRVANPEVTWERSNQLDIGVDGVILNNRLSFTIDYWNELRTGILIQRNASVPRSTGLTLPRENLGKVRSWGYDGNLSWNQQINKDLSFQVALNGGYSTTQIVFWDEPPGAPDYQRSTGRKISTALYYQVTGVFQNTKQVDGYPHWPGARPGDLIFKDVNGDGKIDADDRIRVNKNGTPDWTGGLTLGCTWKQFSATIFFQGSAGAVQYVSTESGDIGNYFADFAAKRWIPDPSDPKGLTPDPSGTPYSGPRTFDRTDAYWSPQGSNDNTYFLRSTDYVRLKTLEIGYSLPKSLLAKLGGLENLRVYVNGYNLITWDKFKLMDPEASNAAGDYYPQTRVMNAGVSLTF